MPKKKWIKPELIILIKGRPEEVILAACKDTISLGPGGSDSICFDAINGCAKCSTVTAT